MTLTNLLLVDDEKPFVETMVKRLTKRNLSVIVAFNGQEALRQLEENHNIEVVVLDVKMPEIDGIETLRLIKNKYPLVEVIMLTGHATIESGIDGMKLGAFDYLMKPCDIEQLIHKVKKAAERKRRHEDKIIEAFSKPYRPKYDMDMVISQVKEEVAKKLAE
jgi:DNA-binding NtrC family response regulator